MVADICLVSSDWHLNPGEQLFPKAKMFLQLAEELGAQVVLNGDILNLLPWGFQKWCTVKAAFTIRELVDALPPWGATYVKGNHDPYSDLSDLPYYSLDNLRYYFRYFRDSLFTGSNLMIYLPSLSMILTNIRRSKW